MKILFFGDGDWATAALQTLIAEHVLLGVVLRRHPTTQRFPDYVSQLGLPVFSPVKVNTASFRELVFALQPEVCLSVSYDQIIGNKLLELPPKGFINLHAAPLPHYRGRAAVIWQMLNGEPAIGLTTHWMSCQVDRGPIILQQQVPLGENDTLQEALEQINHQIPGLLRETMKRINLPAIREDAPVETGSSFPRRLPNDEFIDWGETSRNIHNLIRALSQTDLYAATYGSDGTEIRISGSRLLPEYPRQIGIPGSVIAAVEEGIIVKTGDTAILLTTVLTGGEETIPRLPLSYRLLNRGEMRLRRLEQEVTGLSARLARFERVEQEEYLG